jgi:hypothetical protein
VQLPLPPPQNLPVTVEIYDGPDSAPLLSAPVLFSYDPPEIVAFNPSPLLMDGVGVRKLRIIGA